MPLLIAFLAGFIAASLLFGELQGLSPGPADPGRESAIKAELDAAVEPGPASSRPARPAVLSTGNRMVVPMGPDGHFHITAEVNGAEVRFLVDSGASTILLRPQDARRAGINIANLRWDQQFSTANGVIRGASVDLRHLRVDRASFYDVRASIPENDPGVSLLGMSFLRNLRSFEFEGDRLVLFW